MLVINPTGEGSITVPTVAGPSPAPSPRFRHAHAKVDIDADVDDAALEDLGLSRADAALGACVLIHGGYDMQGGYFHDTYLLWVSPDGTEVRWTRHLTEVGDDGEPQRAFRWHHTATRVGPGRFVLLGGQTPVRHPALAGTPNNVYHERTALLARFGPARPRADHRFRLRQRHGFVLSPDDIDNVVEARLIFC